MRGIGEYYYYIYMCVISLDRYIYIYIYQEGQKQVQEDHQDLSGRDRRILYIHVCDQKIEVIIHKGYHKGY